MKPAILIHTFDGYKWCWPYFYHCFKQHCAPLFQWPIYFCNETETVTFKGMKQIKTGHGAWSTRLQHALDHIPERDIIYMQEDFLITHCNIEALVSAYNIHLSEECNITKLATNHEFFVRLLGMNVIDGLPLYKQPTKSPYIMSHQPIAIFQRTWLSSTLSEPMDASQHELQWSQKINSGEIFCQALCIGRIYRPNKSDIITIEHAIQKGKVLPLAAQLIKEIDECSKLSLTIQ